LVILKCALTVSFFIRLWCYISMYVCIVLFFMPFPQSVVSLFHYKVQSAVFWEIIMMHCENCGELCTLYGKTWSLYKVKSRDYLICAIYVYITEVVFPWSCATSISNNNVSKLAINNVTLRHLFFLPPLLWCYMASSILNCQFLHIIIFIVSLPTACNHLPLGLPTGLLFFMFPCSALLGTLSSSSHDPPNGVFSI